MATVTIRNLSDEVVEALKARARSHARSMEAEVRDALTRLVDGSDDPRPRGRWYTTAAEVNAWIETHPAGEEHDRMAEDWLKEHAARPHDEVPLRDPWQR